MTTAAEIQKVLFKLADVDRARHSERYFKTGPGEYAQGDRFLGIRMPVLRKQVSRFRTLNSSESLKLLHSGVHEERMLVLLILVEQYRRGNEQKKGEIYKLYLANTAYINNWDLVDCSAHKIVGPWLVSRSKQPLYRLASSSSLWERRIAVLSCFHFIRLEQFEDVFKISDLLLQDRHDLIHKAVGWMLREVGNRDHTAEVEYLLPRYRDMPRTMLRYAIEKFPERERQMFLKGTAN